MDLKGIISISGMSGLYKIVATNKNGFIVESFSDKKRFAVSSAQRVSTLEDITIYTEEGDVPLKDVLKTLDEKAGKDIKPDPKADPEKLKKHMEVILPDYDKERVYNSDIKKLFTWYDLLKESDFSFEDEPEAVPEAETKTDSETKKKSVKAGNKKNKEDKTTAKKSEKEEDKKAAAKKKTTATKTKEKSDKETKTKATEKSAKSKTASSKTSKKKSAKTPASRKK
ncbi:MAG: DUF5606 family protein [Bacteroidia bacterium]